MACKEGESVLAMCTDPQNKRLICGDTAGCISVYDIRNFGTPENTVRYHSHIALAGEECGGANSDS